MFSKPRSADWPSVLLAANHPPRRRRRRGRGAFGGVSLLGVAIACGFLTMLPPAVAQAPGAKESQPTLLDAQNVTFDQDADTVTATGAVELHQDQRTVRADKIVYERKTKIVRAFGHVQLIEPSGDVVFADYAELTDDMRDAFIENVRVLMTDNGRMAGNEGERRGGRLFRVNRGVYSPCDLCKDDPTRAPLWRVRAARVVHDKEEKDVRYRDVFLEMFGVPVAYTPYLSHPDPTVDRRSGFLAPGYGTSRELGTYLKTHYYIDIAPDQDATLEAGYYSKQGLLLGGEYRKRFENGRLQLNGALTRADLIGVDKVNKGKEWRGFIAAKGLFDIDENWRWGFDVTRATDRTFLRKYYGIRDDILTSRAFVEGFRGRNYAVIDAYSFQDTRVGNTTHEPLVAPRMRYQAFGEPGGTLGGRWSFDADMRTLFRDEGPNSTRLTLMPGWRREWFASNGFITEVDTSVLAAFYTYDHYDRLDDTTISKDSDTRARLFPRASISARYPFVRYGETSQQIIEPKVQLSFAPDVDNEEVPNEDSIGIDFDSSNLFLPNRYSGIDRLDTGVQATYGVKWSIQGYNQGQASLFVGQSYRLSEDTDYPVGSGLSHRGSDVVTRFTLQPTDWLDVDYRARFDSESWRARIHSVTAFTGGPSFNVWGNFSYRDQAQNQSRTALTHSSYASFGFNARLADRWSLGFGHIQAFSNDPGARSQAATLNYSDECLLFQTILQRNYTDSSSEGEDGTALFFRFVFKNLGEFKSPNFGSLVFPTASTTK